MKDITYCANTGCPFRDCENHPGRLEGHDPHEVHSFAALDSVCRRYIGWLAEREAKE